MEDSDFILRTGETWRAHPKLAGVYLEQLTYIIFSSDAQLSLPDKFKDVVSKVVSEPKSLKCDGFSLPTGRLKIISGDNPLLFAE